MQFHGKSVELGLHLERCVNVAHKWVRLSGVYALLKLHLVRFFL